MSQKAFALILQELRDGRPHAELSQLFSDLLHKVQETGKAGDITLKIKVKPASRGTDAARVTIADAITVNMPKPERGEDFFWVDEDNGLTRNHPRQANLELRDVTPTAPSTFKEVGNV